MATGGPEGQHKFVILMILDYTSPGRSVAETGYAAYKTKFGLENAYPTYAFTAADVSLEEERRPVGAAHRGAVPGGGLGLGRPAEVRLYTAQAERYRDAIAGG